MSIGFGVLTVSDRSFAGTREDKSGPVLCERILQESHRVEKTAIVPDEPDQISKILAEWCDTGDVEVILTSGGTGFAPRDSTPEATLAILDKVAPGISEVIRAESLKITPHGMLSRGVAGIRKKTLIVNLPGSPKGALEGLEVILPVLPHAVNILTDNPQGNRDHEKV